MYCHVLFVFHFLESSLNNKLFFALQYLLILKCKAEMTTAMRNK